MTPYEHQYYQNRNALLALPTCREIHRTRDIYCVELDIRNGKYTLYIEQKLSYAPRIYILHPEIDESDLVAIHTFSKVYIAWYKRELVRICISHHRDNWSHFVPLSQSYIPWAIEWTEFYELWLLTGEWFGEGIHVTGNEPKKD